MKRASNETRRARPLLGTLVELSVSGGSSADANEAIDSAFATIEQVQRLMSFHYSASDVSHLNRLAVHGAIPVSPLTYHVLSTAKRISEESAGAFDITVAPILQEWGYLPGTGKLRGESVAGHMRDIELLPECHVRFLRPLQIDLGGIAKGFAVDRAVLDMQAHGVAAGVVNAGGDLRVFGAVGHTIHVRHPASLDRVLPLRRIANSALATSATYFTRKKAAGQWVSPLVDARRRRACLAQVSVSVQSPTCIIADALTKVLFVGGRKTLPLMQRFSSIAFIVTSNGKVMSTESQHES